MKGIVKAEQFLTTEGASDRFFIHGPGSFYASTLRGLIKAVKGDWLIDFENGDAIVVTNDTYEKFFQEPGAQLPAAEGATQSQAETSAEVGKPRGPSAMEGEDSEPGESGNPAERAEGVVTDAAGTRAESEQPNPDDRSAAQERIRNPRSELRPKQGNRRF